MSHLNSCDKNQKITNFTTKLTRKSDAKNTLKRPISPSSPIVDGRQSKRQVTDNSINPPTMANDNTFTSNLNSLMEAEDNTALKNALGPLITEFRLLRESVDTVERSRNLDRSFRNIYIIPSFPTREQHAHSVQNARSRFTKLNQSYSC